MEPHAEKGKSKGGREWAKFLLGCYAGLILVL